MFLRKTDPFDHAADVPDSIHEQCTCFKSSFSLKKTECRTSLEESRLLDIFYHNALEI